MKRVTIVVMAILGLATCRLAPPLNETSFSISVAPDLFDQTDPDMPGLSFAPGRETVTIFAPDGNENAYNHGVVLHPFKDKLYAQWQTSKTDEDGPDTHVVYSVSDDGLVWSTPQILAPSRDNAIITSGGWWSNETQLVAFLNVWPSFTYEDRTGYAEYTSSDDGINWSEQPHLTDINGQNLGGIIEQDIRSLSNGHLVTAFHTSPGLHLKPFYTQDPMGVSGWQMGDYQNLPTEDAVSREIEPSFYENSNGGLVMLMRDQKSTFKTLASESKDNSRTWSTPELFDFPDSRSKQSAGNLPSGTIYRVNNPRPNKERWPLIVSLSKDGYVFDRAFVLRSKSEMQPLRQEGKYKRPSYSYPKSTIWKDHLYLGYATNKEDIELTRIPIAELN